MFAVIRHTFDINKDDTDNMYADWKHYVWLFEDEVDAIGFGRLVEKVSRLEK